MKAFARRAHAAPGDRWPRHFLHQLRIECNALRDIERAAGADSLIARRVPRCLSLCLDESCDDFRALPHIALTRLEGPTLDAFSRELLETASLVERRNALFDFAHEALITLDHLWSLGFVHRDLSGANLIVLRHPSRSTPVAAALVDFDAALHVSACPTIEQPSSELQGASDRCMPNHLLPPPPRDGAKDAAPITFNLPPELWAPAFAQWTARPTPQRWHRANESFAFDGWGLGMALLHKMECEPDLPGRIWRRQLEMVASRRVVASQRAAEQPEVCDEVETGDGSLWLRKLDPQCFAESTTPPLLLALLASLLASDPAARGPPGRLLTRSNGQGASTSRAAS